MVRRVMERRANGYNRTSSSYPEFRSTELASRVVDPKDIKLGHETDASGLSAIGSGYIDSLRIASAQNLDPSYLSGDLGVVRGQLREAALVIKDSERALGAYYDDMPELLAKELDPKSGNVLGNLYHSSDEVLRDFLVWNSDRVATAASERQPELDNIKEEFARLMQGAINRGLPLSEEQLITRLSDSQMTFADPVSVALRKARGTYRERDRLIQVPITSDNDELRSRSFHELTHLVSGSTVVRETDDEFSDYGMIDSLNVIRDGLADRSGYNSAPLWMREALTEQVSQVILTGDQIDFQQVASKRFFRVNSGAYRQDRKVLSVLVRDIPATLAAYFEDAVPSSGGHLPYNEYFWDQLEHEYGKGIQKFVWSYETPRGTTELKSTITELKRLRAKESIKATLPPLVGFDKA